MSEEKLLWETKSQESIVIFSPKGRRALLGVGATVFLILCGRNAFETVLSLKSAWDFVLLFLWLLMAIGCALLVFTFLRLNFKPLLIINREGIEDHSHLGKSPVTIRVKWEEIALISTTNERRALGFQVALTAKGQQSFLARQNRWSRFFLRTTTTSPGDFSQTIVLPQLLLPIAANSLIAQIKERFLPQLIEHHIILQQDPWVAQRDTA
ncbi:MAG TPA: STM3941 family protein [Ktedonobacteraceae bacterium]